MKTDRCCHTAKLASLLVPVLLALGTDGAIAQITPASDGTGTRVTGTQQFNITGGTQASGNLFHNFQQFGLNAGQTANFISNPTTQNILGRVTGGNASLINGLLQVSGSNANLYLINPSGIVFGKNANLNIPGSFTATTANGIGFGNGQWFNAIGSNNYAVLTSNPTSFGFIGLSGSLINAGNLAVNPGQSIALVGGTVVNTGMISAPGGNITIVAVPGEKLVRIGQDGTILSLDLPTTDKTLINAPTTTPIALPELLTGGSIPNAMGVVVEDGVIKLKSGSASIAGNLTTNGIGNQTGGNVITYADNHLNFSGMISAKGGELGGNGGFVDTSGKGSITIAPNAQVITTAAKGLTGNWVIDPADLEVVAGTGGTIVTGTNSPTTASTIGAGTIVTALNTTNVNLQATNSITVNAAIDASANVNARNLTLTAPTANLNQAIKLKGTSTLSGTATTVNVGALGTVQNGIDVASTTATGTVNLAAATYKQGSTIGISKNVTVRGLGLNSTIVSGNNQHQVFNINSGTVTLDQMSIVEGSALSAAGISNRSNLIVSNSSINNNNGTAGSDAAGIGNSGSLQILRSTIRDNTSRNTGGIINSGTLTIEDSTLSGNRSNNQGGAILNSNILTIRRSTVSGNNAGTGSGGIYNTSGSARVTIDNSTITGNTSGNNQPSGISGDRPLDISNSIVSGNSGANGVEIDTAYAFRFNSLGYNIFGQNESDPLLFGSIRNLTDIIPTITTDKIIAPLGDYGGPTKTHALIPNSIAINMASPTNNSIDQRGISIQGGRRDIGAYESKGFALLSTNSPQSTTVDTPFANPLNVNLIETAFSKPLPIAGITIGFTSPGSTDPGAILLPTALTNAAGAAQVSAVANTKAGMYNVQANSTGVTGTTFSLTNTADVANAIVYASGSGQTATVDRNFRNNLIVTVIDRFENPVPNSTVTFSLPSNGTAGIGLGQNMAVTDMNGQASIAIKANTKAGAFRTIGNVAGVTTGVNFDLTNIADVASSIDTTSGSGQTTTVDRNFANNLIATVTDKFGNPVSGSTVTFSLPGSGASGILSQTTAATDANGQASIALKANTKAGSFITTGTIANVAKEANFNLINNADAAYTIVATSGSDQTAVVDTNFTNNLVATVSDKFENPVQNQTVIFSLPGTAAGAALIQNTAVTDVNGQVSIPVTATRKVGSFTTQAAIVGIPTVANFNLTNIIDNATKTATTQSTQTSTTTVTDKSGNSGGVAAVAGGDTIGSSGTTTSGDLTTTSTSSTAPTDSTPTNSTSGEPSKPSTESTAVTPAVKAPKSNSAVSVSVPTLMMLDKEVSKDFEGMGSVKNSIAANMDGTFREIEQKTGAHPAIVYFKTIRRSGNSSSDTLEFTILTSKGRLSRTVAIDMKMIDRDVVKFRKEVTNPIRTHSTSYLPMAKRLYNSLIAPILPDLKASGITNLVLIPEAGLRGLPYAALHDGKQFLIEQFSVSIMPSLSLVPTGYRDIRPSSLLSMGISKSTQGQTALPMVETELTTIGQFWKNSSTYLNDRATSSLLQNSPSNQEFQILHLATHANFIAGNPKEAYIQFWNDRFRLDQLKELDWNKTGIDLLVLSACKTAVGDDVRSDINIQRDSELGFAGLALQSGVRTVVASLWSVSDTGTMGLISSFYERLLQSPIKAEALRQAQVSMLKGNLKIQDGKLVGFQNGLSIPLPESALGRDSSFRHPYYWSAFTMVGNPW